MSNFVDPETQASERLSSWAKYPVISENIVRRVCELKLRLDFGLVGLENRKCGRHGKVQKCVDGHSGPKRVKMKR